MKLCINSPLQALNKAFRKEKIGRDSFTKFKNELNVLISRINEEESEEHLKYPLRDFLRNTFYADHEINTKGRTDLGIYLDKTDKSKLGVIIEAKKPSNAADMIHASDINKKAMHEAILYYLRERIEENNNEVKTIIITNIYEWFIFNAHDFERLFYKSQLTKEYGKWKAGQKTSLNTPLFYNEIAKPFLDECDKEISATWFDLRDYKKGLDSASKQAEKKLSALYKIFSGATLLKESFANDSNSLDKRFYNELLHIIGLEERKEGSKKTIKRKVSPNYGSLIENTITTLEANEKLYRVEDRDRYGNNKEEQLFHVALELVITWINRILFLKLLEAQLVSYHQGNKEFRFLDNKFITDFDELNELFFEVLAKQENERKEYIKEKFRFIPYLNSSLFELKQGSLEDNTILISNLKGRFNLPVFSQTVLRNNGKRLCGELPTLRYLFDFLDAYDFASEGAEDIQEENKTLINASVLGLIFEKINGYKDGSFFTPGFITMYMCRETIRRAVLQKFEEIKGWKCESIEQLKGYIENRSEANEIINNLKICDPAVGSGHFLVSALNEIITIKSELGILSYQNGNRIKNYTVEIANDELIITDKESEEIFEYRLNEKGRPVDYLQEMQEALFHEKQTIIENCLFGVDINPNSVNICRLRLWIELLKNSYYTKESGYSSLETLPNIDINIKCGNSLVSRFALDADLSKALKTIKYNIHTYRKCVVDYKNAKNKGDKRSLEILINQIKGDFRDEIQNSDPKYIRLNKVKGEMASLITQTRMFELSPAQKKEFDKRVEKLAFEQTKLEKEITEIRNNIIYRNAFEWRFEFPEVLDDEGNFIGFDVAIGNPPYIRHEEISYLKHYLKSNYLVFNGKADIFVYFFELTINILRKDCLLGLITSNKFIKSNYGNNLRKYLKKLQILNIIDFGELPVFEEAATFPSIYLVQKSEFLHPIHFTQIKSLKFQSLSNEVKVCGNYLPDESFEEEYWSLENTEKNELLSKMRLNSLPLGNYVNNMIFYGIKTGYNKAFIIDETKRIELIRKNPKCEQVIFPFVTGDDIRYYHIRNSKRFIILTKIGIEIECYPEILEHLSNFKNELENRCDKGNYWYELRACSYYEAFEGPKIVFPDIAKESRWAFSQETLFFNNTAYFIPSSDFYLLGVMNSKAVYFYFSKLATVLGDASKGGRLRWFYQDVIKIPIPIVDTITKKLISNHVSEILAIKKNNHEEDTIMLESEINRLVYKLYGLTEEEIKIVESSFEKTID